MIDDKGHKAVFFGASGRWTNGVGGSSSVRLGSTSANITGDVVLRYSSPALNLYTILRRHKKLFVSNTYTMIYKNPKSHNGRE